MTRYKIVAVGVLTLASFSPISANADYLPKSIAAYGPEDCAPVVEQKMDQLGIIKDNVSNIDYIKQYYSDSEAGEEYEFEAWASFKNCKGNFVINMNKSCQISRDYTLGNCELGELTKPKS